jgi:hypothetical protein
MYKSSPTSDVFSSSFAQLSSYVVLDSAWCLLFCLQQANPYHFPNLSLFLLFPTLYPSLFFRQRHIIQFTYPTNMHRQKAVAQILLILSILHSVLAAPILIREMPGARGAVAVRVPAEGVVAKLEKRPFEPLQQTGSTPGSQPGTSTAHPSPRTGTDPYKGFDWEGWMNGHNPGSQPGTSTGPTPGHSGTQSVASSEESGPLKPQPKPQPQRAVSSNAVWKQKIMTPEKIKAAKYFGAAGLLTAAYMSLLFPEIMHNDGKDSQS